MAAEIIGYTKMNGGQAKNYTLTPFTVDNPSDLDETRRMLVEKHGTKYEIHFITRKETYGGRARDKRRFD